MGISRSTYYEKRESKNLRLKSDTELATQIKEVHLTFPGYGYRRVHEHFLREGIVINTKRIRRVMRVNEIYAAAAPKRRRQISPLGEQKYFPNLIAGMELTKPNQLWATDFTYVKLRSDFIYVSAIIDVYTRKIIGWSIGRSLSHEFCLQSLEVALKTCPDVRGITHHSDRGIQYSCGEYVERLEKHGFKISMSRKANPQDNAFIESFFKTLKTEEIYFYKYKTMEDVINHLPTFIDEIYNEKRIHSSLGYMAPAEFESAVMKLKPADRPVQKIWKDAV